jgi:transcriptional activator of cad operon
LDLIADLRHKFPQAEVGALESRRSLEADRRKIGPRVCADLDDRDIERPGLRVPPPTSSFYFKGKQLKVSEIAKSLGVAYVLDGSVRKSDTTMRIAARLIRADDGFVIWSETYDRPLANKLMVQDDIAGEVAKALRSSIN